MNMVRILLVDDDAFNREGIRLYLQREEMEVLEAGDEAAAWGIAQTQALDAAVVDISIPADGHSPSKVSNSYGIRLANRIKQTSPAVGVVIFSAYGDRGSEILDMIREGTRGLAYKLKGNQPSALLAAIHEVIAGRVVIDPEVHANRPGLAEELIKRLTPDEGYWVEIAVTNFGQLTPREMEIAQRLAASHNTEGISQALSVSSKTTENYITHIYDKLGLNNIAQEAPHLRKVVILAKACMINDLRKEGHQP
ncbi:MAG: response regulator transcription factor [Anaerolineales bacterium]